MKKTAKILSIILSISMVLGVTIALVVSAFAVSANVEGEELDGYVKLINLLQSSQEWSDLILYGVEGKDYNISETRIKIIPLS